MRSEEAFGRGIFARTKRDTMCRMDKDYVPYCSWCGGVGCDAQCRHVSTDEGVCCPRHAPASVAVESESPDKFADVRVAVRRYNREYKERWLENPYVDHIIDAVPVMLAEIDRLSEELSQATYRISFDRLSAENAELRERYKEAASPVWPE